MPEKASGVEFVGCKQTMIALGILVLIIVVLIVCYVSGTMEILMQ